MQQMFDGCILFSTAAPPVMGDQDAQLKTEVETLQMLLCLRASSFAELGRRVVVTRT
jgi:hypothetical protein